MNQNKKPIQTLNTILMIEAYTKFVRDKLAKSNQIDSVSGTIRTQKIRANSALYKALFWKRFIMYFKLYHDEHSWLKELFAVIVSIVFCLTISLTKTPLHQIDQGCFEDVPIARITDLILFAPCYGEISKVNFATNEVKQ